MYTLSMDEGKEMGKHYDDFNKIILNLNVVGVKIEDKDQAVILISSLPKVYEHFVDTILHGKQSLFMSRVKNALNSKDLQRKTDTKSESNVEGLIVRGMTEKRILARNDGNQDPNPAATPLEQTSSVDTISGMGI